MRKQSKKIIAPVIITVLIALYLIFSLLMLALNPVTFSVKIIGIIVFFALISVSGYVLVERIKEIRSGEEDDLSKY